MANEIFENIWKIMKENKFQLIDQINNELICNICNKLMVNSCSAPCGCKYCSDCIANYLDGEDKFCPGKNKYCQMKLINFSKHISINYPVNMKISEIVVKCPNKCCEFTDKLSSIENHMRTCNKNPTSCPYLDIGCKNDEVMIDEMKDHLCTEIYCHSKLILDFIANLRNEMELMKNEIVEIKFENKHLKEELDIIKFESKNNRMKNEEFEEKIKNNLLEIEELNEEMMYIKNENRSLMNKLENIEKSRINEMIERMQRKSEQQTREIDEMKEKCERIEFIEFKIKRLDDEIFDKNVYLMKSNNYDEKINNLQIKISEMEKMTDKKNFGKFEWKIENFDNQQRETHIYSEPFYSHKNGYKMCLSVWLDSYFFNIHLYLMRGEFDNDLLWPFKHGITIDIINQMNGNVFTSNTIEYDGNPANQRWNKPTSERNEAIYVDYIEYSDEIVQNNQMIIKCKINI